MSHRRRARTASRVECALCLENEMDCSEAGLTASSLVVKAGYWRPHNTTINIKPCPVPQACVNSSCVEGHTGPFCMVCAAGYSRWRRAGLCEACPDDTGWSVARSIAALILCLFLIVLSVLVVSCWAFGFASGRRSSCRGRKRATPSGQGSSPVKEVPGFAVPLAKRPRPARQQ